MMAAHANQEFVTAVLAHVSGDQVSVAQSAVERYFVTEPFTGRFFDMVADRDSPDEITPHDLLAVEMLGVQVPPAVALWILGEGRTTISGLLAQIPTDVDIWNGAELLTNGSPAELLWQLLGTGCWPSPVPRNGMGMTKRSKLLAAKRPRLLPVLDAVVRDALPSVPNYWQAFAEVLATPEARLLVGVATSTAGVGEHVSLLRRLDVVLWMAHRPGRAASERPGG